MTAETNTQDAFEIRELSMDEIDATAGAGIFGDIVRAIKGLFGGNDPQPPRGPFNNGGK